MTIGENIQFYRKKLGMSQETLGQKLLVSRQTISLWENDQTMPSIDNLIRLKEIFGVSVDKILSCDEDLQKNTVIPSEIYRFKYSGNELSEVQRFFVRDLIIRLITFAAINLTLLFFLFLSDAQEIAIGVIIGILFFGGFLHVKGIIAYKKTWKNSKSIMVENCYEYQVYNEYIRIIINRNNETVNNLKINFNDIEKIQDTGKYLLIIISERFYILSKADLPETSAFYSFKSFSREKPSRNKYFYLLNTLSVLLVIASILSIFFAMFLITDVPADNGSSFNTWMFYLFTPIPIASIVLGFILKSKGYKYKKNVIVGIIMTVLLCLYGSFYFVFEGFYDHSDEPIIRAEQFLDIDIPEYEKINTIDMTDGTQSNSKEHTYYKSDVYFDENYIESFESQIANDDRWLSSIPSKLIGIASEFGFLTSSDFSLIYNVDSKEYNTLPEDSGKYHFISIFYHKERNQMEIIEYDIDYIK